MGWVGRGAVTLGKGLGKAWGSRGAVTKVGLGTGAGIAGYGGLRGFSNASGFTDALHSDEETGPFDDIGRWMFPGEYKGEASLGPGLKNLLRDRPEGVIFGPPAPISDTTNGFLKWDLMDPGTAPSFNKSLADYLNDPVLNNIANQQVIAENAAIGRENKDIRTQMVRNVTSNNLAGQNVQNQMSQIGRENTAAEKAVGAAAAESGAQAVDQAAQLAGQVGASTMANDYARSQLQTQAAAQGQDIAAQQASDSELLAELAGIGQDTISELAAGEAMQTRANAQSIRTSALDDVAENRAVAKDNWGAPRQNLIGSLAKDAMAQDVSLHQLALQEWGAKADRQKAWYDYQLQNKQLEMESQGSGTDIMEVMKYLNSPTGLTTKRPDPTGQTEGLTIEQRRIDMLDEASFRALDAQYGGALSAYGMSPGNNNPWLQGAMAEQKAAGLDPQKWYQPFDWFDGK